jgi:hypothetical protein
VWTLATTVRAFTVVEAFCKKRIGDGFEQFLVSGRYASGWALFSKARGRAAGWLAEAVFQDLSTYSPFSNTPFQ